MSSIGIDEDLQIFRELTMAVIQSMKQISFSVRFKLSQRESYRLIATLINTPTQIRLEARRLLFF